MLVLRLILRKISEEGSSHSCDLYIDVLNVAVYILVKVQLYIPHTMTLQMNQINDAIIKCLLICFILDEHQ